MIQRVLIRHGIGRDKIALLVDDMRRSIEHLDAGPNRPDDDNARTAFHH